MKHSYLLMTLMIITVASLLGCVEASFNLASNSRLPKWFEPPEGMSRKDLYVKMDYLIGFSSREAVFRLYDKNKYFCIKKVTGLSRGNHPLKLMNQPTGFPKNRPSYEVITVNGVADIIEHRSLDPIFYVTDDPAIWKEFGVAR